LNSYGLYEYMRRQTSDCRAHFETDNARMMDAAAGVEQGIPIRVSRVDMHIGDLVYLTNQQIVTELNQFLEQQDAPFGPFTYVSDASVRLKQLRRSKPLKAEALEAHLKSFAESSGYSLQAFEVWDKVIFMKDRRDLVAHHPIKLQSDDLSYVKVLIANPNSEIAPIKEAVQALLTSAEKLAESQPTLSR
jgi:hypothetical protein